MRYAIITIVIFTTLFLMVIYTIANAFEPEMRTTIPVLSIPEWIEANNPPCDERAKIHSEYSKLATDGKTCWRYRPWVCVSTGLEGVDVEHLPLSFCGGIK